MQSKKFEKLTSKSFVLPQQNVDTDQIYPARFLTTTEKKGLGRFAFYDWRFDENDKARDDVALNAINTDDTQILVAGRNFGCGSSREHAPWALTDFGFRAIISSEIADIFRSNASKNGLLPIIAPEREHAWLIEHPDTNITVDLVDCVVSTDDGPEFSFEIEPFVRHCLLNGTDSLGFILSHESEIEDFARRQ